MTDDTVVSLNIARALDFIERLQAMDSSADILDEFQRIIGFFGCSMFSAGLIKNPGRLNAVGGQDAPLLISTWPDEWEEHWLAHQYWHVDPVVQANLVRSDPFEWKDVFRVSTPEGRNVFFEARAFGLIDGFTVPSRSLSGPLNTVTVVGERLDWSPKERAVMHLVCLYFTGAMQKIMAEGDRTERAQTALTPREVQVLNYIAAGKTSSETADIIGVSDHTVGYYMRNIMTQLDCRTRTQAVVEAYRRGLIRV